MAMVRATKLSDFYDVFAPEFLKENEMDAFYCENTMKYRTGSERDSPIDDIEELITNNPSSNNAVLFLGHRGCGKSTELVKLASKLRDEQNYNVKIINCNLELDLDYSDTPYWELFILLTQKLIEIANELDCDISKTIVDKALSYWYDKSETTTFQEELAFGIESEVSVGAGLKGLLGAFIKASGHIKNKSEQRTDIIKKVERRAFEWIEIIKLISHSIQSKSDGKMPILILEELDKINDRPAIEIFCKNASVLSQLPFKAIYTFPINLFYSEEFSAFKGRFQHYTLPMIKVHNKDMTENKEGINIIKNIVYKRADECLFDEFALEEMIKKTGGALRDLFEVIMKAGAMANRQNAGKLCMEDAKLALNRFKSDLLRTIEVKDYEFLTSVHLKKEQIPDSSQLLRFMRSAVVLEYNGMRWHDLHPLVYDFLKDQGIFDEQEQK